MTRLRPTLKNSDGTKPTMDGGTAYLMILKAVEDRSGLIHGKLEDDNGYCAIGCYFNVNDKTALPSALIDEIAAVNDSVPHMTRAGRKRYVSKWLRWKLTQLGMPGFRTKNRTTK